MVDRDLVRIARRERGAALLPPESGSSERGGPRSGHHALLWMSDAAQHGKACPCLDGERDVQRLRMSDGLDGRTHLDDQRFD
eukprot:3721776-Prymnesium_polylepis.2